MLALHAKFSAAVAPAHHRGSGIMTGPHQLAGARIAQDAQCHWQCAYGREGERAVARASPIITFLKAGLHKLLKVQVQI